MADSTPKSYHTDPNLYLYTSLTAGSSHIITATSRLETILKANKIPFLALDVATDEKARMLWGRRAGKRKLPGLVKMGVVVADLDQVEEWNEYGEIKENLGAGSAADPLFPTPSAPSTPSKPPKSASVAAESTMLAATPPRSVQKSTTETHPMTAMRKAGLEAAKKAVDAKSQSRAPGESKTSKDVDQGGGEEGANKSTTAELRSSVELKTPKVGESKIITSDEQSSSEEEGDELDEKKAEERAVSELKTLPIRQKPQNPQEGGKKDEEGDEEEDGDEKQDEEGVEPGSQNLPISKPSNKGKKYEVNEEVDEDEEDDDDEEEEDDDDAGYKKLPISKPPVKATKASQEDNEDDDEDEDEDEEDDKDGDEEDEENETPSTTQPAAPPLNPKPSGNDPPKFKTGGPLLDHRKINPAKNTANKK
ncbi:hypothetical protein MMC31_007690 [Peltigera leucophlebia]|nr:hypothetical protein [Peltigera leucophlebia]